MTEIPAAMLRDSINAWNAWRQARPDQRLNLSRQNLTGADLAGADLSNVDLSDSCLDSTVLDHASFERSDLRRASLQKASGRSVNFELADLIKTNLTKAVLPSANLASADLSGAILRDTDLVDASMAAAGFASTILCGTRLPTGSLESVRHYQRSYLDPSTLSLTGNVPTSFLKGCGWSDNLVAAWANEASSAHRYRSCFISHSSEDAEFAHRLYASLQSAGVRCWFAPVDMPVGARLRDTLEEMVHHHDRLLLVCSKSSLSSRWVEDEVEAAFEREASTETAVLLPIRLDDSVLEAQRGWPLRLRRTRNIANFQDWGDRSSYKDAFDRLLGALRSGAVEESATDVAR